MEPVASQIGLELVDIHSHEGDAETRRPESADVAPAAQEDSDAHDPTRAPIDMETFDQLLEMDDGDDFAKLITEDYLASATRVLNDMEVAYAAHDLHALRDLAYFLKGSSEAVGAHRIRNGSAALQNLYGARMQSVDGRRLSDEEALSYAGPLLAELKAGFSEADAWFKDFFITHVKEVVGGIPVERDKGDGPIGTT